MKEHVQQVYFLKTHSQNNQQMVQCLLLIFSIFASFLSPSPLSHYIKSMHWATPKTKDRMLPDQQGNSSSSSLSAGQPNQAHRRASEGGAALYFGNRKAEWGTDNSDVTNKFRNYEI